MILASFLLICYINKRFDGYTIRDYTTKKALKLLSEPVRSFQPLSAKWRLYFDDKSQCKPMLNGDPMKISNVKSHTRIARI